MEEPKRSRHVTRAHSNKKTANGNGYSGGCTVYDDVFGGPPKYTVPSFPPCVDEYADIFRGSSTVPFLDFSCGFFDGDGDGLLVSGDSYADIFGGYGDDFLVSFEELIRREEARAERKESDGDRPKRSRVDIERKSLQKVLSKVSDVSLKKSDRVLQKVPSKLSSISSENSDGTLFSSIDNIPILSNPASQHLHESQKQLDMTFHMKNCKVKEHYRNDRANHQDASFACEVVVDACLPNLDTPTSNSTANPVNNTTSGFSVIEEAAQIKPKVETSLNKSSGKNSASMPSNEFKERPSEMEPMPHLMENDSCLKAKTKASSTSSSGNFQPETLENELQDNNRVTHTKPLPVENSPSFNLNVQASCNDCCVDKSTGVFMAVTEINLQTHPTQLPPPTRPPPKLGLKSESKKRLGSSVNNFKENGNSPTAVNNHRQNQTEIAPETHFVEEDMKQWSPTFLDVEVDANSDAAASAAAMKEVMEEAKAKLKILKASMARRNSLKTNKSLHGREKKRSKEHKNCEAAQEFFDCNIEMDPEVWDVPCAKIKNSGQVERSKEIKTPKDIFELQEKQKCLDLAENCSEKGLGNRQDVVKEFVKHEMKGIPNDCARQAKQGHEIRSSELVFKLQEKQRCFELGQKCAEEKLGNGSNGVNESQQQNVNKKDYKMEELSNQEANNKMPQRVVQASEKEQQEKKFKPDEETHEIAFNSATGQSEVERPKMAQEVHQKEGKEKSPKTGQKLQEANEQECQNTVAREAYDPKENLSRLKDGQSSSMQDMVYKTKQVDAEKLAEADPEESLSRLKNGQASGTQEEVHDNKQVYAQSLAEQEEITKLNKEDQEAHEQEQKVQEEELTIKKPQPEEEKDNLKTDQKECDGNEMGSRIPVVLETIDQKEGSKEDSNKSMKGETSRLSDKVLKREENAVQELVEGKTTKLEADQVVHEHEQNVQVFRKTQDSSDVDASEKQPDSDNKIPMQEIESQKLEGSQKINQSEQKEHTFKMSQQEAEKEKNLKTDQKNWKENEGECEFPMAWGTHEQRESSNRLSTYHASRKQDDTCNDIEQTSYEPVEHEETTMLKADTNHVSRKQNDLHSDEEKTAHEPVELEEITMLKTVQEAHEHEHNKKKFTTVQDSGDLETNAQRTNIAQGPMQKTNEKKSEVSQHINQLEKREQTLKATNQINEEQKIRKFSDKTQERAEKEKTQLGKERLKRELEQEMEQLMKLEEEKERVREREKDRIAVERATHEARDKAIPDAWERAERAAVERATAEAREKASMERREKAEKIPPESKEKIPGEKISTEGRIKPDQAAIDRATAEARERAAERAIVEKVAAEARERMERAVAERFAASLKEKQRKDNECDDGASTRVNSARHTSTSDVQNLTRDASSQAYSVTKHTEIGVETEKRRQAKLERYQRTTERTAKALAEKKARDILAQREQAERNRLAESLDADIRRWSNGKEGNLRALISTLQYILGLESGWQPVPLTEVITSAAVKKAYRKATLCVHPDKVQQRGASIQQKYISEKVFDLLKEAWNKFNSEER